MLARADAAKYLVPELRPRASELKDYLGGYVRVVVPPQKFYSLTGEDKGVGLAYPEGKNLFRVRYYAVDCQGGLIANIREVGC